MPVAVTLVTRDRRTTKLKTFLSGCCRDFVHHGSFTLARGENVRQRVLEEKVPAALGVYLIAGGPLVSDVFCIGRAGTLRPDGSFGDQRLSGRLCNKQAGESRQQFFLRKMEELRLDALDFYWFVTFDDDVRVIPAKAEADLLQAFYDLTGQLPRWNRSF